MFSGKVTRTKTIKVNFGWQALGLWSHSYQDTVKLTINSKWSSMRSSITSSRDSPQWSELTCLHSFQALLPLTDCDSFSWPTLFLLWKCLHFCRVLALSWRNIWQNTALFQASAYTKAKTNIKLTSMVSLQHTGSRLSQLIPCITGGFSYTYKNLEGISDESFPACTLLFCFLFFSLF